MLALFNQATGASVTSPLLYNKSKALTELELSGLGYEQTIIFRPGLLVGTDRSETRIAEQLAGLSQTSSSKMIEILH